MVADALKGDRIIGMTTLKPGYEADYQGRPPIYEIGCAGVITDVEELPGGRSNIVLRGLVKFRVTGGATIAVPTGWRTSRHCPKRLMTRRRQLSTKLRQRLEELITTGSGLEGSSPALPTNS